MARMWDRGQRKAWSSKLLAAVLCGTVALSCSPATPEFKGVAPAESSVGELVHAALMQNAARAEECSAELQASLVADKSEIVESIDLILDDTVLDALPTLMAESVLPQFDNGSLESVVDIAADALELLVDDEFDPQRKTLEGLHALARSSSILQDQHLIEWLRRTLEDPEIRTSLVSFSELAQVPDGNQSSLDSLLGVLAVLTKPAEDDVCQGLSEQDLAEHLLDQQDFVSNSVPGPQAWVARVDSQGLPQVATDPATGEPYAPFVDQDGDGLVDRNEAGEPVDASGSVIELAPFGFGEGFDASGRRLSSDGSHLYDYFDTKATALAHGLRLGRGALDQRVHADLLTVLDASMGQPQSCGEGCEQYQGEGSPAHRLLFTLLEVAQFDRPVVFMESLHELFTTRPELAEDILVSAGTLLQTLRDSNSTFNSDQSLELVDELLPLVARIFRIQTSGGQSMPRLLMDVVNDLGDSAQSFPEELLVSIEHTTLIKDQECSSAPPSPSSPKVDFERRRFFFSGGQLVDNRSSIEKSIELLADADCGSVPFTGGKSVANAIIDLMSRFTPETVCNLIDDLLGVLGFTGVVGEAAVNATLFLVGCNDADDVEASDLFVLDDLAKSGALDFYLPIAKAFREEGQLDALIPIFQVLADDLRKDEDNSSNTASSLRPLLPILAEVIRAGAVDAFFELNDHMVSAPAVDGNGSLADVLIDSAARLVDDQGSIVTVDGPVFGRSLASELLRSVVDLSDRVSQGDADEAFKRLSTYLSGYLRDSYLDDQGTADPSDDRRRLREESLVPLATALLGTLRNAADLPTSQYQCYLHSWQSDVGSMLSSPELATLVRVARDLEGRPEWNQLESFLVRQLDPAPTGNRPPAHDELLRMFSEVLQNPGSIEGTPELLRYVARLLEPGQGSAELLQLLGELAARDEEGTFVLLLQNLLGPSQTPSESAPLFRLMDAAARSLSIDADTGCQVLPSSLLGPDTFDPALVEEKVEELVQILRDEDSAIQGVFELLRLRSGPFQ